MAAVRRLRSDDPKWIRDDSKRWRADSRRKEVSSLGACVENKDAVSGVPGTRGQVLRVRLRRGAGSSVAPVAWACPGHVIRIDSRWNDGRLFAESRHVALQETSRAGG